MSILLIFFILLVIVYLASPTSQDLNILFLHHSCGPGIVSRGGAEVPEVASAVGRKKRQASCFIEKVFIGCLIAESF
jgi:hypothetical protein